jgi:hypothetical protein
MAYVEVDLQVQKVRVEGEGDLATVKSAIQQVAISWSLNINPSQRGESY